MEHSCSSFVNFETSSRAQGKNYIVCCGSTVGMNRCNKAGIQIRGEDGVLDGNGNVAGHGVDATGNVTDIKAREGSGYGLTGFII